jgi:hypothetical protein
MGGGPAVSAALSNQTSWDRALQKYFDFRSLLV